MTAAEFAALCTPEARAVIEANLTTHPADFALRYRDAALATQLKYLQRSRTKLPALYAVRGIVPPLAFEQCSSEAAAATKDLSGETCLDLTCGLGIDTGHFARTFRQVVTVEQDPVLADVVRYNLHLLSLHNVTVHTGTAEDFIANYTGAPFDWIYLDPARRDDRGKKVFLPEDCEPDFVTLLPQLRKTGRQILVKLSPMYDVDAALRQFPDVSEVGVLSLQNECKEVWLRFGKPVAQPCIVVKCQVDGAIQVFEKQIVTSNNPTGTALPKFILEPDVAFYKARMVTSLFAQHYAHLAGTLTASDGFFLSENAVANFPGRVFKIITALPYQPKKLITLLKQEKIGQINIVQRNFPAATADIRAALRVKEGGERFLIATMVAGERVCWIAERTNLAHI